MRVTIFSLAIIAAGLLGAPQTASAQTLYNYQWCLVQAAEGHTSCSFQTEEQCRATALPGGLDGNCYRNWDYKPFPGGLPPPVIDTTARTLYTCRCNFFRLTSIWMRAALILACIMAGLRPLRKSPMSSSLLQIFQTTADGTARGWRTRCTMR